MVAKFSVKVNVCDEDMSAHTLNLLLIIQHVQRRYSYYGIALHAYQTMLTLL